MTPAQRVVVVAHGQREARQWTASLARAGLPWRVLDVGAPPAGADGLRDARRLVVTLDERVRRLERFLTQPDHLGGRSVADPEITLVGHRRACLVVQRYALARLDADDDVRLLRRLRQIVLVNPATPNWPLALLVGAVLSILVPVVVGDGASASPALRALEGLAAVLAFMLPLAFGVLVSDEQRRALGIPHWRGDAKIMRRFEEAIVHGAMSRSGTWPIPVAQLRLRGPVPRDAESLQAIAEAVEHVAPHVNLYDVACFERSVAVRPITRDQVSDEVRRIARALRREDVLDDNEAEFHATVAFTARTPDPADSLLERWELGYRSIEGLIVVHPLPQDNLCEPRHLDAYEQKHDQYRYEFHPRPLGRYALHLRVYGGYSGAQQGVHSHLRPDAYYHEVLGTLDLTAYLDAWELHEPPRVTYVRGPLPRMREALAGGLRTIEGMSCRCASMDRRDHERVAIPVETERDGMFAWRLERVRDGGVLDVAYHLHPRSIHGG